MQLTAAADPAGDSGRPGWSQVEAGDRRRIESWPLVIAAPFLFAVVLMAAIGRYGFFPADEGLVETYAVRVLAGQVPHLDFVSPRPIGSSLLHLPTLLAGGPWIMEERFIAALEIGLISLALTFLALRGRPARLGVGVLAATVAAAAINIHTFPLMAWYTVDGLLLVAGGYALVHAGVRSGARWRVLLGLLLIGLAATTKQSFVPAAAFGLGVAAIGRRHWVRAGARDLAAAVACTALAPTAYVLWVVAAGGAHRLLAQSTTGAKAFLLAPVSSVLHVPMASAVVVGSLLIVAAIVAQRRPWARFRHLPLAATIAATLAVVALPMVLPRVLWYGSAYGWGPFWFCSVVCAAGWIVDRQPDPGALLVVSAGWMASLSWGAPYPNLVAGSLTLVVLMRLWESAPLPSVSPRLLRVAAVVASALVVAVVIAVRGVTVYHDSPAADLSAGLSGVSPALAGVVTNPITAAYLEQIKQCTAKYRASRVAVMPDGAGADAALGLQPALPIDWLWPSDYHGSAPMIVAAAARLRGEGDALVLWETFDTGKLPTMTALPVATLSSTPFDRDRKVGEQIRAAVGGLNDTCGSFLVRSLLARPAAAPTP